MNKLISRFLRGGRFLPGLYFNFVSSLYPAFYNEAVKRGFTSDDADRYATHAVMQNAHESGYGTNAQALNYNYGGMKTAQNYGSPQKYAAAFMDNMGHNWPLAMHAADTTSYVKNLYGGVKRYSETAMPVYLNKMSGTSTRVVLNINRYKKLHPQWLAEARIAAGITDNMVNQLINNNLSAPADATQVQKPTIIPSNGQYKLGGKLLKRFSK